MLKIEYANAYKEVLDILKYVSKEDFEKIPAKKIEMFSKCANYNHYFEYNPEMTLKEQNVSDIAQTIIAILFRDYWATDEQREKIIKKEKYDMQLLEEAKKEKYNPDLIFKQQYPQNQIAEEIQENKEESMIHYKENIFTRFFNFIRNIFK